MIREMCGELEKLHQWPTFPNFSLVRLDLWSFNKGIFVNQAVTFKFVNQAVTVKHTDLGSTSYTLIQVRVCLVTNKA